MPFPAELFRIISTLYVTRLRALLINLARVGQWFIQTNLKFSIESTIDTCCLFSRSWARVLVSSGESY